MRRVGLVLAGCLLVQLITPGPAQAWWGWWDELSGAGPFKGFEIEARVVCFGEVTSHPARDGSLEIAARQLAFESELYRASPGANPSIVQQLAALTALSAAAVSESVTAQTLTALAARVGALRNSLKALQPVAAAEPGQIPSNLQSLLSTLTSLEDTYQRAADRLVSLNSLLGSAGVAFSACPIRRDVNRRVSVNMTFRLMHSYGERKDQYAGGNEIKLAMFVPTVSWRPLAGLPKADIIDLSAGAGVFWFSSDGARPGGFEPFNGVILEPIRVDFHFPSALTSSGWVGAILAGPSYRRGWAIFPAGFKANAFGVTASPEQAQQISAEWVKNAAFFWDVAPLIHYWAINKGRQ